MATFAWGNARGSSQDSSKSLSTIGKIHGSKLLAVILSRHARVRGRAQSVVREILCGCWKFAGLRKSLPLNTCHCGGSGQRLSRNGTVLSTSRGHFEGSVLLLLPQVCGDFDLAPFTVSCFLRFTRFLELTVLTVKDIVVPTTF